MHLQSYININNIQTQKTGYQDKCNYVDHLPVLPLDNITDISDLSLKDRTKPLSGKDYRKLAYDLRQGIIKHLYDKEIKHRTHFCGRSLDISGVTIAKHKSKAFYAGVAKCGNRWVCPVCAAKVAGSYKEQLQKYIESAKNAGDKIYFLTLTLQHNKGDSLDVLLKQLSDSWNKLNTGRYLQKLSYYITTEILYGQNGWHPHYHILLNTGKSEHTTQQIESDINKYIVEKWTKLNPGATLQAQDVKQCNDYHIADYMSKNSLSYELTAPNTKNNSKGVHPWHLINSDKEYLFKEYITATKKKRVNRMSKGFFKKYKIEEKTENEALHEEEVITETVAILSNPVYKEIWRKGYLCDILENAECDVPDILFMVSEKLERAVYIDCKSKSIHFDDQ